MKAQLASSPVQTVEKRLANEFSRVLRSWLTPREMAIVIRRNLRRRLRGDLSICHSHDFCDANQAILDAFEKVIGREWILPCDVEDDPAGQAQSDADSALMDAAWDIAKAADFKVD